MQRFSVTEFRAYLMKPISISKMRRRDWVIYQKNFTSIAQLNLLTIHISHLNNFLTAAKGKTSQKLSFYVKFVRWFDKEASGVWESPMKASIVSRESLKLLSYEKHQGDKHVGCGPSSGLTC